MNIKNISSLTVILISLLFAIIDLSAQNTIIEGRVIDKFGNVLSGVTVRSEKKESLASTNFRGEYSIKVNEDDNYIVLVCPGYLSQRVEVEKIGHTNKEVILQKDIFSFNEEIQLGHTSVSRKKLTGSVATVRGKELEESPAINLTQSFAGRFSGLLTQETSSELTKAQTAFYIRGISTARNSKPLVVIDGIIVAYDGIAALDRLSPHEIESVSILKDASTQALYGIQGANGVIVVTTKRGLDCRLHVNTYFNYSFEKVGTSPTFINSWEYAELRNQAAFNDGLGTNYFFSPDQIEKFRNGLDRRLYPNNDWYSMFMKDYTMMQKVGLSVSGGNQMIKVFSNIDFLHQGGQFKTDPQQTKYNPSPNNILVNFRTNIDANINQYLKGYLRLSGNVVKDKTTGVSNSAIYNSLFQMPSTEYGPVTPVTIDEITGEITNSGGNVIATEQINSPTFGLLNRTGYKNYTTTNIDAQLGINVDLDFLIKDLYFETVFAYQTNSQDVLSTTQDYERWERTSDLNVLEFTKKGNETNSPLIYNKSSQYFYHLTYKAMLNYAQTFFNRHEMKSFAYIYYQNLVKPENTSPLLFPYNRLNSGLQLAYNYDEKYFLQFDLGYSGSEQYAKDKRYIATPSVSAAWIVSAEPFFKGSEWLTNLKLRGSYGKTANDQTELGRYPYLDEIRVFNLAGPIKSLQHFTWQYGIGNPGLKAETSKKYNLGVDFELFNKLSVSFDIYKEMMDNMVVAATNVPAYQGIDLEMYPASNTGRFENKGYEISVNYTNQINKNTRVALGGSFIHNKNVVRNINEIERPDGYFYKKQTEGFPYGQKWGYMIDYSNGNGFFNSQEEIRSKGITYEFANPRIGDLIYKDLNGDNVINDKDVAPIASNGFIPPIYYSFTGEIQYKLFSLKALFQGVADYHTPITGIGVFENQYASVYTSLHKNAWTQKRYQDGEKITYPALSLTQSSNHQISDFINYNRSYLRLKNLEFTYTLPRSISKIISSGQIKIIFRGHNLFTWDKMKTSDFGPEDNYGSIPVYKVYSIGASVNF